MVNKQLTKKLTRAKYKGTFLKKCQGYSDKCFCCNYYTLNVTVNCPYDCSYCFLQEYDNQQEIIQYTNVDDALKEIDQLLSKTYYRIGTGELGDSLALDSQRNINEKLCNYFDKLKIKDKAGACLELKTKSINIKILLKKHYNNVILSWSLNSQEQQKNEERAAPAIKQRLRAAKKVIKAGYPVTFHFDPIIYTDNWQKEYEKTIKLMRKYIEPEKLLWLSLGTLRFPPVMRHVIRENHPNSKILYGELLPGFDEKMRYPSSIRRELYLGLKKIIHKYFPNVFIYLCMESPEMWTDFDKNITSAKDLAEKLNTIAYTYFTSYNHAH